MAVAALKTGKHVLLEKPMAVTVTEARAIAQAAKRAKRVLTVYQPHRLMAYHQQTRQVIASGKLGKVYHVKRGAFGSGRRNDWQTLLKFGGGMVNNTGAHFIDQLFNLTGSDIDRILHQLGRVAALGDAEDVVKLVYQTRIGMLGEMEINQGMAASALGYEPEVYGSHGVLWKEQNTIKLRYLQDRLSYRRERWIRPLPALAGNTRTTAPSFTTSPSILIISTPWMSTLTWRGRFGPAASHL